MPSQMGSLAGASSNVGGGSGGGGDSLLAQVQERLKSVYTLVVKDVYNEHNKCTGTVLAINKMHEKLRHEDKKLSLSNKQKLRALYSTALEEAKNEERVICQALEKIYEIHALKNERRLQQRQSGSKETIRRGALMKALHSWALPLWTGKPGEKPPPLCGAIPADFSYVAKVGDMVAALQRSPEGDDNWILAEVVQYNSSTSRYEVEDIDEEQKERLTLSRRRVIPLPLMRACPDIHPEALFQKNTVVMALYPQTTCFYKGIINSPPKTPNDEYEVLFEDATYPEGYSPPLKVAQRYVIAIREKKTKA